MPLNLIRDPWIPVITSDGTARVIAPWQMAQPDILRPDWPRADLNLACLELLIGLVLLADPPADVEDWDTGRTPERLQEKLAPYVPAFNLTAEDGPRFLQDIAPLAGEANPLDMLFIDSAGGQTIRNNADLMVWRDRYPQLGSGLAAMALYAFQAFAPAGGAGNRTSMRGGGPLVTLVQPQGPLWATIWANVPDGQPAPIGALPWMRPTVTSEGGRAVFPEQAHPVEAFFGMPRRLRLVTEGETITGVIQRPYGTNYAGWDHPLTPSYRLKLTDPWLPKHPRAGLFGYRHWLGTIIADRQDDQLTRRAATLRRWFERAEGRAARVLVGGWAMENMKPRDFVLSAPPLLDLTPRAADLVRGLVLAAEAAGRALSVALVPVMAAGEAREAQREAFFAETQPGFEAALLTLAADGAAEIAQGWLSTLRRAALSRFEALALPGLGDRDTRAQREIVDAHRALRGTFAGYGKFGAEAFRALDLPLPAKKPRKEAA